MLQGDGTDDSRLTDEDDSSPAHSMDALTREALERHLKTHQYTNHVLLPTSDKTLNQPRSSSPDSRPIIEDSSSSPIDSLQFNRDKESLYNHPLFPLIVLLMEKCEYATATLNYYDGYQPPRSRSPSSSSSNSGSSPPPAPLTLRQEMEQILMQQSRPLLTLDRDLDSLVMKILQVLRIHLMEMEKVQDLCKDFSSRYISCLRTKMSSENLLRGPGGFGDEGEEVRRSRDTSRSNSPSTDDQESRPPPPISQLNPNQNPLRTPDNSDTEPSDSQSGTVYQIVQTSQGLIPSRRNLLTETRTSESISSSNGQQPSSPPKSFFPCEVGPLGPPPTMAIEMHRDSGNEGDLSDDASNPQGGGNTKNKSQQKRGILPKQATSIMRSWLFQHIVHPYPTEDEKRTIASQTNLTLLQVNNWFINARRRILQPMLDSANSALTSASNDNKNQHKKIRLNSFSSSPSSAPTPKSIPSSARSSHD